ncbi:MAG: flagellar hook-length control protein FliK [Alphaproteobacteria bacterium]|nr:flagellar hook-length control protein FliK [Alphaproteobacteria bacterium]
MALPTDGAVDANASGVDLLKQIGAIVQQLQALLKSDGKQTVDATAGTDSDANALVNLTGSLQADVTRLSQLVQQNKSADLAPSLALLRPQSDDQTLSADEIKAVLKNAIAQVKEGLQQLRGDNEKFFADARAAFDAAAQANAPIAAKDVVLAFKNVIQPETKISASNEDALPVVAAAVATPALNPIVTPQATILNGLPVAAIQGNTNNSANDSGSGNNQGQGASTGNATPLASQLSAPDAAAKSDFAKALDRARLPVLDQVVFNIKKATADGSSKISIQLDPMELGKLEIKLHVGGDGKTAVVVTADNKNTLDLLQRDAQGLMRALNDAGLQADSGSLSFNLRGGDGQGGQNSERSQAANTYKKIQPDDEADIALNAISRSYTVTLADGLDIKI